MAKQKSIHYVNNRKFYELISAYLEARKENPRLPIPDSLGTKFQRIVNRYATRPNFANYSYLDEMKSDALELMCRYIGSFKPERSNNPFAYFTQVAKNAFRARINRENREKGVRIDLYEQAIVEGRAREDINPLDDYRRGNSSEDKLNLN